MEDNNLDSTRTTEEPTKILLAIMSIFLLAWLVAENWSFVWAFARRHPGILAVLIGVSGEMYFDWRHAAKEKHARWMRLCMSMVVLGLGYELYEAANADKEAEELRADNLALYRQIQPRRIDRKKRDAIAREISAARESLEKRGGKMCKVLIKAQMYDLEARLFSRDIIHTLSLALIDFQVDEGIAVNDPRDRGPNGQIRTGIQFIATIPFPAGAEEIGRAFGATIEADNGAGGFPPVTPSGILLIKVNAKPLE